MTALVRSSLICPALVAIALSVWVRPEAALGEPFLTLTIFLVALPFLFFGIWLAMPKDPYGHSVLGLAPVALLELVAIEWLLGVMIVLLVRAIRARAKAAPGA